MASIEKINTSTKNNLNTPIKRHVFDLMFTASTLANVYAVNKKMLIILVGYLWYFLVYILYLYSGEYLNKYIKYIFFKLNKLYYFSYLYYLYKNELKHRWIAKFW